MAHTIGALPARASSTGNPITFSQAVASGETVMVVMLKVNGGTNRAGGALTWGSYTLTQANTTQKAASSPEASAELWYLLNPPVGTQTLTIPNTGGLTVFYQVAFGKSATPSTTFNAASGSNATGTNPSPGAIASCLAGDIVFAVVATGAQTWAPSAQAGTVIQNNDDGANGGGTQYSILGSSGSFTLNWTFGTSDDYGAVAAAFSESPNVSVTLAGSEVTASAGTINPANAKALAGEQIAASQGSLSAAIEEGARLGYINRNVGPALPFQAMRRASIDPVTTTDVSVALTGIAVATSMGTIAPATERALSGQEVAASAGILVPASAKALAGESATGSAGTLAPSTAISVTGQAATASPGTVTPDLSVSPSGESLTVSQGSISVGADVQVALTGEAATIATGTLAVETAKAVIGQSITVSGGAVSSATDVGLVGQSASVSQGSVSVLSDTPQAVGRPIQAVGPAMPFQAMRRNAEQVSVNVSVSLTGLGLTTYTGSLSVTVQQAIGRLVRNDMMGPALDFQPSPRNRQYTPPASPDVSVTLNGQSVTASAGTLVPVLVVSPSGQSLTVAQGSVNVGADAQVTLSGEAATAATGTLVTARTVSLSGQALTVSQGSVSAGADVQVTLSGVIATTAMGTLTASRTVAVTGLAATVSQGSVSKAVSIALSGQQVSAYAGTLSTSGGSPSSKVPVNVVDVEWKNQILGEDSRSRILATDERHNRLDA